MLIYTKIIYLLSIIIIFLTIYLIKTKLFLKRLQEKADLSSKIIDNAPFSIFVKNLKGDILIANEHCLDLADYTPKANIENIWSDMEISKKEDNDVITNKRCLFVNRYLSTHKGVCGWRKIIKIPLTNQNNEVTNILVFAVDINEEMKEQQQKDTFVATITHDLKTPINAEITALNLLLQNTIGTLNDSQYELVKQILDSCYYTKNLVHTILDSYLYENGQIKISLKQFNLYNLINLAVSEIQNLAKEKEQTVINDFKISDQKVIADEFQIKRVIINLLSNAIKYGLNNSTIKIVCEESKTGITVYVKNVSKYIEKESIKEIYEKFGTAHKKCHRSGLGLYLTKQIITSHRGYVFAKSEENRNCTFGFVIPKIQTTAQ